MEEAATITAMQSALAAQKAAASAAMPEPLAVRRDRLTRGIALLVDHGEAFAKAVSADFGNRSRAQTLLTDVLPAIGAMKHARTHLSAWSRGERRATLFPLGLLGAHAEVRYQPKGVVGVVAPWNFPIGMVMVPMAGILAAGNRALVKPSEFTPRTSDLLAETIGKAFAPEEIAVFTGGAIVGQAFCALAFDHIIFTGATAIGRHVMRAAADNLVPVTLELGGKSPTIVGRTANIARAGERIAMGKMMNAGQVCLAPDYLFVAREQEGDVIEAVRDGVRRIYPTLLANDDYASIVSDRIRDRLQDLLNDARAKGAELIEVNAAGEDFATSNGRKMPLTIVRNPTDDMAVMREEIFGPILPVKTYDRIDEVIEYVNSHDRPLGLYWFGTDTTEREAVVGRTISGGVTVNDVAFHVAMEDLPFGGTGASGMGRYHGRDGFLEFSHVRAVYRQPGIDVAKLGGIKPPFGKAAEAAIRRGLRK